MTHIGPLPQPGPDAPPPCDRPIPPLGTTALDDQQARRLLASTMDEPSRVWAYACAVPEPGAEPVDEILLTELGGDDELGSDQNLGVVWVRSPDSFTGAAGHLLGGTGRDDTMLLRRWEDLVFKLADLVDSHACRIQSPTDWPARFVEMQAAFLRWTACYGVIAALHSSARDDIRDTVRAHPDGGLTHDLGDLTADGAAQIIDGYEREPAALIPPGWTVEGWDHTRPRTHPILSGLRPHPPHRKAAR
ncbi:hypothetical protein ACFOY4_05055 [Actinomadura syzygii]|uniref:Uncharacterized protein n=1 Tax=Actinomadura syzygii TaxID=1427538 RepID=A0A5D0TWC8_9ACTN|nr:hypothetical protein [Actinomadura syzygii]TYC10054.1 hypothetical protein FXF65_33725 [Actinomadura syzygii]